MESGVFLKIKGRTKGFRAPWQQDLCMSPHFSSLSIVILLVQPTILLYLLITFYVPGAVLQSEAK